MAKIGKWRLVNSEYLIRRPWLTARRDTVELPDGRINDEFYILEYPTWVNVIAIDKDGRFVMVEQFSRPPWRTPEINDGNTRAIREPKLPHKTKRLSRAVLPYKDGIFPLKVCTTK